MIELGLCECSTDDKDIEEFISMVIPLLKDEEIKRIKQGICFGCGKKLSVKEE